MPGTPSEEEMFNFSSFNYSKIVELRFRALVGISEEANSQTTSELDNGDIILEWPCVKNFVSFFGD